MANESTPPANSFKRVERLVQQRWLHLDQYIITRLDRQGFVIKVKPFTHDEKAVCYVEKQHGNLMVVVIKGKNKRRERMVGYYLLYAGRPIIHQYTNYLAVCYSEPTDVRYREVLVVHSDEYTRLYRAGVGVFDYFWGCRKKSQLHHQAGMPACATYLKFAGAWRDGM